MSTAPSLHLPGLLLIHRGTLLHQLAGPPLEVGGEVGRVLCLVGAGDDPGRMAEEEVHLLEGQALGLGQDEVEEDGVGEVANLRILLVLSHNF